MRMLTRMLFLVSLGLVSCSSDDTGNATQTPDTGDPGITQNDAGSGTTNTNSNTNPEDAGSDAVALEDTGTDTTETNDMGDDTGHDGGSTSDPNTPQIVDFTVSPSRLNDSNQVIVSALVTDPQGFADIGGGRIIDQNGDVYANFIGSGGSFSATLTWTAIQNVSRIDFLDANTRSFTAEFFDASNNRVQNPFSIELHCEGASACNGVCGLSVCTPGCGVSPEDHCESGEPCEDACDVAGCLPQERLTNDDDDCGVCGNACGENMRCRDAACVCDSRSALCNNVCTNIDTNPDNCGGCNITCTNHDVCSMFQCVPPNYNGAYCSDRFGDADIDACPGGECSMLFPDGDIGAGFCRQPCDAANTCASGLVCDVSILPGGNSCYKTCTSDANCGPNEICGNPFTSQGMGPNRLICGVPIIFSAAP